MSDNKQNNLRMVNPEEGEGQTRRRRKRRLLCAAIIIIVCVAVLIVYLLLVHFVTYREYTVTDEIDRSDTQATHYLAFGDGYVTYSNDGAAYVTTRETPVWNQGYEMENPMVTVCQSYFAIADQQGETVYVLNEEGLQGEIAVSMPISKIAVASQGTVAVLMMDSGTGYLSLFDKTGDPIAEGAIHVENTGTPMDIALSTDGKNLAAAIVDVSTGTARTTLNFYNFGAAGQNQIDNLVGSLTYADTIIPEITYVGESTMLAFADTGVYVFEGDNAPQESAFVEAADEIQSVFYDDSYFGLVYADVTEDPGRRIDVYDTNGHPCASIVTDYFYDSISFLKNHEICLLNEDRCDIYTANGRLKVACESDGDLKAVFRRSGYQNYLILTDNTTERVRMRLFASLFHGRSEEELP